MASRGLNKVMIIGNLGNEPEIRVMPNGNAVANFSIATSETWRDRNTNEQQERTEWHRVVIYGKLAEIVQQYVHKGSKLYIEGRLQTRKWQDNNGQDRYTTEIIANEMQMLDSRGQGAPQGDYNAAPRPAANNMNAPQSAPASSQPPVIDDFDDDIPF